MIQAQDRFMLLALGNPQPRLMLTWQWLHASTSLEILAMATRLDLARDRFMLT